MYTSSDYHSFGDSSLDCKSPKSVSMTNECPQLHKIDVGEDVWAVTFSANRKHLVAGCENSVQVWQVKDGKQVKKMSVDHRAYSVAASSNGKWIATGSRQGEVFLWNTKAYKKTKAFADGPEIQDINFSPDSTRLVFAQSLNHVTMLDVATRKKVRTSDHGGEAFAATYSPRGDGIATASYHSIRVWNSNNGRLLVDVGVGVGVHRGLLWRNSHLFVATPDKEIKKIDASSKSTISEWQVLNTNSSSIALPQHGRLIAYTVKKTITFLDTSGNIQPGPVQHTDDVRSISFSLDDQLLAIAGGKKIVIRDASYVLFRSLSEPKLDIDAAALDAWKQDQLADAETSLSAAIPTMKNSSHHVLANRALVRARLGNWDSAIFDAKQSVKIQRSVIGYIAMCVALVGKGETDEGFRACDIASLLFPSDHVSLLLIKAVVLFMAGKHVDAISRLDGLITDAEVDPKLYVVQAYMHLLLGNKHMESSAYECAIQSFEDAQIKLGSHTRQPPLIVTLISGWRFNDLASTIQQRLCEALLAVGRTKEASESVLRMEDQRINMSKPIEKWINDFKNRCRKNLENLGDSAVKAKQYEKAVSEYSIALSLVSASPQSLLVKRSKTYAEQRKWKDALNDANEVIKLDPSSSPGYERKYVALCGMGLRHMAIEAFETMMSKMSESPDLKIRERHYLCVQTREAIRKATENATRDSPLVLINTSSGRLYNKSEQVVAFESTLAFTRLVVSMTTHVDHGLVENAVGEFYRYTTLSHTWEDNEPLYEKVIKTVVYDLAAFPTHDKLQSFCKIVRDEGFDWAWSDTCCINKGDQFALQEALISMFKWYEGSAMTIVYLCDVDQLAEDGALTKSLWNSRAWALQEYRASKVVRFYAKDWTPYLGLTMCNHKESPQVISEMEKAIGISAQSLMALRPGLKDVREKLRLASTRRTTRVEDVAYSLLGVFSVTLPVMYGEGDMALGRLLSQLLMSSGDTSILAWTGESGSFNSCLPRDIVVFSQPLTSHIPPAIPDADIDTITTAMDASSLNLNLVTRLYDQLSALPLPLFVMQRMKLPCLAFKLRLVSGCQDGSELAFRAHADVLGDVEIRTKQNLSRLDSLYLVYPWVDFLLDRHAAANTAEIIPDNNETSEEDKFVAFDFSLDHSSDLDTMPLEVSSLLSPEPESLMAMQAEFLARLRQPFGALLLTPTRRNMTEFRRIATESLVTARVQEITSSTLDRLMGSVRVLDVL